MKPVLWRTPQVFSAYLEPDVDVLLETSALRSGMTIANEVQLRRGDC